MKILMFSDLHVDHKNTEAMSIIDNTLKLAKRLVVKEKIHSVFFLGDLIDTPYHVKTPALDLLALRLQEIVKELPSSGSFIILKGNHDLYLQKDKEEITNISWLKGYSKVVVVDKEPYVGVPFLFVPYYADGKEFLEKVKGAKTPDTRYLLCHQPINKMEYSSGIVEKDGVSISKIPFDKIFTGHYHKRQLMKSGKKLVYGIGSPLCFNFSDEIQGSLSRGFVILELNLSKENELVDMFKSNPYTFYYQTITPDQTKEVWETPLVLNGEIIPSERIHLRIKGPSTFIKDTLSQLGDKKYASWKSVPTHTARPSRKEGGVELTGSKPEKAVKEYVSKFYKGGDPKAVIEIGLQILKEAKNAVQAD